MDVLMDIMAMIYGMSWTATSVYLPVPAFNPAALLKLM
jgi:hypothetical protein